MELLYLSHEQAATQLLRLMRTFVRKHGFDVKPSWQVKRVLTFEHVAGDLATRPGMFLGSDRGWDLRSMLTGMNLGGDWLGLRRWPGLRRVVRAIQRFSMKAYGSGFAAYRLHTAPELLERVGVRKLTPGPDRVLA